MELLDPRYTVVLVMCAVHRACYPDAEPFPGALKVLVLCPQFKASCGLEFAPSKLCHHPMPKSPLHLVPARTCRASYGTICTCQPVAEPEAALSEPLDEVRGHPVAQPSLDETTGEEE